LAVLAIYRGMNSRNSPVQHDGEFVLTCDGSRDFGEIKAETGLIEGFLRCKERLNNPKRLY